MGLASRFSGLPRFEDDVYVRDRITTGEQSAVRVRYVGDRLQHSSNGKTSTPNFGFESHTGVVGMTFFLPQVAPAAFVDTARRSAETSGMAPADD